MINGTRNDMDKSSLICPTVSSIITETEDDKIASYLVEKIMLSKYENTGTALSQGILAAAMSDKDYIKKHNALKNLLQSQSSAYLRQKIANCIVERKSLATIEQDIKEVK
jgi:hypothetical protein